MLVYQAGVDLSFHSSSTICHKADNVIVLFAVTGPECLSQSYKCSVGLRLAVPSTPKICSKVLVEPALWTLSQTVEIWDATACKSSSWYLPALGCLQWCEPRLYRHLSHYRSAVQSSRSRQNLDSVLNIMYLHQSDASRGTMSSKEVKSNSKNMLFFTDRKDLANFTSAAHRLGSAPF